MSPASWAAQIIPTHIDTADGVHNGFGPGLSVPNGCKVFFDPFPWLQAIECDTDIPQKTFELAGWGGYIVSLTPAWTIDYLSIEVWHDGGTPHLLDHPHWSAGRWTLGPVFYPAGDGHKAVPGDRVFARFWCVGVFLAPPPVCTASLIGHFRIHD